MRLLYAVLLLLFCLQVAPADNAWRDPFHLSESPSVPVTKPASREEVQAPPRLELNAILKHDEEYIALVNGNIVRERDTIAGCEVVAICSTQVRVRFANREYKLDLK